MTTATKFHPELECSLLDILAAAKTPLSSTELSVALTGSMRSFVQRHRDQELEIDEASVMTYNSSYNHWEVTGSTITKLLEKRDDITVTLNNRRSRKLFALTTNVVRWAAEKQARDEVRAKANLRFVIETLPGTIRVIDKHTARTLASFVTLEIPVPEAESLAAKVQLVLVRRQEAGV